MRSPNFHLLFSFQRLLQKKRPSSVLDARKVHFLNLACVGGHSELCATIFLKSSRSYLTIPFCAGSEMYFNYAPSVLFYLCLLRMLEGFVSCSAFCFKERMKGIKSWGRRPGNECLSWASFFLMTCNNGRKDIKDAIEMWKSPFKLKHLKGSLITFFIHLNVSFLYAGMPFIRIVLVFDLLPFLSYLCLIF